MQVANISLSAAKHQMGLQLRRQSVLECRNSGLTVKEYLRTDPYLAGGAAVADSLYCNMHFLRVLPPDVRDD